MSQIEQEELEFREAFHDLKAKEHDEIRKFGPTEDSEYRAAVIAEKLKDELNHYERLLALREARLAAHAQRALSINERLTNAQEQILAENP